jgi:hypothetical protein
VSGRRGLIIAIVIAVMVVADTVALVVHLATSGGSQPAASAPGQPGADPPGHKAVTSTLPPTPGSGQATPGAGVTGSSCRSPQFVSSSPTAGWNDGAYNVSQDEWNARGFNVDQTMYACSYSSWYVVADMDTYSGQVKTYPNSHLNFDDTPVSEFSSVSSSFAETSPHVGIYEDAYDIWLNGVARPGSTEIMIWNDNYGQRPKGSVVANASFGGRSYQVWRAGDYVAFVAGTTFTAGTVNLLQMFNWVTTQGWMPPTSVLSQVDYGAELVSTDGSPATFTFSDFSVSSS